MPSTVGVALCISRVATLASFSPALWNRPTSVGARLSISVFSTVPGQRWSEWSSGETQSALERIGETHRKSRERAAKKAACAFFSLRIQ